MEDYICHYGRKNQKWGVRNGPPYPIEDTVLRAGTRLNSVTSGLKSTDAYLNSGRSIYTYRPDELWDKKVYEGAFAMYRYRDSGSAYMRVHEFETTEDMKMPTSKERKDRFKELLNDKKKGPVVKEELKDMLSEVYEIGNDDVTQRFDGLDIDNIKTKKDLDAAYNLFLYELESPYEHKSSSDYMNIMQKNYDAMVDDNDQGNYYEARDPIIVFNARKFLKDVSDQKAPKYLSLDEMKNTRNNLEDEYAKARRGKAQ